MVKGLRLIWHATIWVIWTAKNEKIFSGLWRFVATAMEV